MKNLFYIIALVASVIIVMCTDDSDVPDGYPTAEEYFKNPDKYDNIYHGGDDLANDKSKCIIASESFIKKNFNYPEETEFERMGVTHEYLGNEECTLLGKVVAKNAFGVKTAYIYKIWLKYKGGDWSDDNSWEQKKIVLEEYK